MKIAIFGKMRSGKNTVADILKKEYGFNEYAFGDGIGEIIDNYFPEARVTGKPRYHYQYIGQNLRVLNHCVWINYLLKKVKADEIEHDHLIAIGGEDEGAYKVVVTDGRQFDEAKCLKEAGYIIIKVVCPERLRIERMKASGDNFTIEQLYHETERQVDLIEADIELTNDGTLAGLQYLVKQMMKEVLPHYE